MRRAQFSKRVARRYATFLPPRIRGGRPAPDRRRWVIRPDDLLVLAFDLVNLRVEPSDGEVPAQLVKNGSGQAFLIVTFPPQHLIEKAFFTTAPDYPVSTPSSTDKEGAKPPDPDAPPNEQPTGAEEPDDPPIDAIIAGWSRLVFLVPDDRLPIPWTLDGLLEAMRELELSVPANAMPPRAPRSTFLVPFASAILTARSPIAAVALEIAGGAVGDRVKASPRPRHLHVVAVARARRNLRVAANALRATEQTGSATRRLYLELGEGLKSVAAPLIRPEPRPPTLTQTALELPYEVILSPNRFATWFHADTPATSKETGHTELWHTRLGVRHADGSIVDGHDPLRAVRAVWTTDHPSPQTPSFGDPVWIPPHVNFPWRMSLDTFDRHNVVHLSSNFRLQDAGDTHDFYEPRPLDVDLLALSSLGAWLDSRGSWTELPRGLSVEEWRHRATLGRDHYVRVVYAGFLFPWGHRASVIKVTERQFHPDKKDAPAYLRQRMFLVVREPLKTYRTSGLAYEVDGARKGEQFDLMMPFTGVHITTRVSPLLDPPEDDDVADGMQGCFWPTVQRQPFKFHIVATDIVGNRVDLAMPLIFVGKENTDADYANSIVPDDVVNEYETRAWPDSTSLRATVPVLGQRMAFAEDNAPDDTTFAVRTLTFGAEVPIEPTYNGLDWRHPRFFPVVRRSQIDVPSLQSIARTTDPVGVTFAGPYLQHGFEGDNAGEVFLAADPQAQPFDVTFSNQGDRSGGLVTPDLVLSGLSRITGPISGDLATAAAGSFNPAVWFGALTGANLFGVISLADILEDVGFNELDKLPHFVGQSLNKVEQLVANLERLRGLLAAQIPAPSATASVAFVLDQLLDDSTGAIPTLLGGGGIPPVEPLLAMLVTELGQLKGALDGSDLSPGARAVLLEAAASLPTEIGDLLGDVALLQHFADGDLLPESINARFEWRPLLKTFSATPFQPNGNRNLLLSVQAAGETYTVTCSLDDFVLNLGFVILAFDRVQLRMRSGEKPEVDVAFNDFTFGGPLSFVQTLTEILPLDGFADPPDVQVTAEGITAGFGVGLPNISIGVFSLENLAIAAGFSVPFLGPPVSAWFRFCERENPARLTVSLFGGGFFFGINVNADGLQVLEGAIEFGAAISVDFGVASGGISAMAGLYFKIEGTDAQLAGYFRLRGEVEALAIVSVSIELYLEMRYESGSGKCVGTATISVEIDVALFSTTIEISCTKKFAGSGADPTFAELMEVAADATSADWNAYCAAFA